MDSGKEIRSTRALVGAIEQRVEKDRSISLGQVLESLGHRSFGPFLLLVGLIMAVPGVGDIPGVPTMIGIFVFLLAAQILFGRTHIWLPERLLRCKLSYKTVCETIRWLRSPARFLDRMSIERLAWLTRGAAVYVIAITCIAIALTTPAMEIVLITANVAGVGLALFGLALVTHDGLLALCGYALTAVVVGAIAYYVL